MIIDSLGKTLEVKIVYFGVPKSGKATTLKYLLGHFGKKSKGRKTLFLDYGIISFRNAKWELKIQIYSISGKDANKVPRMIPKEIDGIIFIVDSQKNIYERNIICWNELESYFGDSLINIPKVITFNKQDLPNKFSHILFLEEIHYNKYENIDIDFTIACNGEGVLSAFLSVLRFIFKGLI